MNAVVVAEPSVSSFAKQRLAKGFRCYARPEQNGFLAICVDLNLHASGATFVEARARLHDVINNTIQVAAESQHLDQLLSQPPNHETLNDFRATLVLLAIIRAIVAVFRFVAAVRDFCASSFVNTWEERAAIPA